jgi:uncharacterized protein DUF6694
MPQVATSYPGEDVLKPLKLIICLIILALPACGGPAPVLDTTDDAKAEASLKAMTADMTDAEKKRFQEDCDLAVMPDQFSTSKPANGSTPEHKLKSLNGLTVDQIREKASVLRVKLSRMSESAGLGSKKMTCAQGKAGTRR